MKASPLRVGALSTRRRSNECLEDLIAVHDRACGDLKIESIEADGLIVTIHTEQPVPALLNYLSDPYGCIIDMQAGVTDDAMSPEPARTAQYRWRRIRTDAHEK